MKIAIATFVAIFGLWFLLHNKDSEIPTSSETEHKVENFKFDEVKKFKNENKEEQARYSKEYIEFPAFAGQKEALEYNNEKKLDNDEMDYNDETIEENSIAQEKSQETNSLPSYSSIEYQKQLEGAIQESMSKNYPRPPVPANLSPFDDLEEKDYRKPTKEEISKGTGDFPPMPPAMYLKN